jgi:preprotein translocase subunit SecG
MATFLSILLFILTLLLIGIIMLQRGRGGGLAGALGGMGGQSAFGTRAGDVFTKITAYMALVWVALACLTGGLMRSESERFTGHEDEPGPAVSSPADDKAKNGSKDASEAEKSADESKPADDSKSEKPDASSKDEAKDDKPAAGESKPANDEADKKSE